MDEAADADLQQEGAAADGTPNDAEQPDVEAQAARAGTINTQERQMQINRMTTAYRWATQHHGLQTFCKLQKKQLRACCRHCVYSRLCEITRPCVLCFVVQRGDETAYEGAPEAADSLA